MLTLSCRVLPLSRDSQSWWVAITDAGSGLHVHVRLLGRSNQCCSVFGCCPAMVDQLSAQVAQGSIASAAQHVHPLTAVEARPPRSTQSRHAGLLEVAMRMRTSPGVAAHTFHKAYIEVTFFPSPCGVTPGPCAGVCLLPLEVSLTWGTVMVAYLACPPRRSHEAMIPCRLHTCTDASYVS